jgi:hypothetical protein
MKYFITAILIVLLQSANAQEHQLQKLWETDTIVAVPESVLPYTKDIMYVSLIDGAPWDADGRGAVAIIDRGGKHYNDKFISGLNAPKGMGVFNNSLYVADISEVAVIDTKTGMIIKKIAVPGASGLNDITVSDAGSVFVSDSKTGKIWKIDNDIPQLFMDSVNGVNGLKAVGDKLLVLGGKSFISVNSQKQVTKIAELLQGGDGIEPIGNGDYIASSWVGLVYYVHADGRVETMLDTTKEKRNTADIGYDPVNKIVYVPTFNAKTIAAYQLK